MNTKLVLVTIAAVTIVAVTHHVKQRWTHYLKRRRPGRHQYQDGDVVMLMEEVTRKLIWGRTSLEWGHLGAPVTA